MSSTPGTAGGGSGGQEEDKKPMEQHINLKVKGQVDPWMKILDFFY